MFRNVEQNLKNQKILDSPCIFNSKKLTLHIEFIVKIKLYFVIILIKKKSF